MIKRIFGKQLSAALMAMTLFALPIVSIAQTRVSLPSNKYSVQDDVRLGREVQQQVEQQFPLLREQLVIDNYVETVGQRLVRAIPSQFRQPAFNYRFDVVNASDINAFALPGGPMYVNRGMIEAARNEGEMAGVMAHEIAHIALRHATAQATETQKFQIGSVIGQIAGAIIGGGLGQIIGAGSQIGFGIAGLKYSREYEEQADILGAHILANAGYDPRDLAAMFQTIQRQSGGSSGPEFLSSHPNPGNRFENINEEAARLRVSPNPIKITPEFRRAQERLNSLPPAPTLSQIQSGQAGGTTTNRNPTATGRYSNRIPLPSTRTRVFSQSNSIRVSYPANWREFSTSSTLTFAPDGAYGDRGVTHGALIGLYQANSRDFSQATENYVNSILQANPYLRRQTGYSRVNIAGRQGLATTLAGQSSITGRTEVVTVYTVPLRDGNILYIDTVVPQNESSRYSRAFQNMIRSLQISG